MSIPERAILWCRPIIVRTEMHNGVFRKSVKGKARGTFQVNIFKSVQNIEKNFSH